MEDMLIIKKKYVLIGLIVAAFVLGYFLNSAFSGPANEMQPQPMQNANSMASHHQAYMKQSSGFFYSAVGKKAPDFALEDIEGNAVKLSDYEGKYVVLFFNEGSMCYPSCWNQISELSKDARFNNDDTQSFSIVVDSQSQWQQIMGKVPSMSGAKILFDPVRKTSIDYDVLFAGSSMHKGSYPGHTYFVIDKNGFIRYTLDDPRMALNNDKIASSLEALKGA